MVESEHVEFKREYVDELKKTIVAFTNTKGGKIYIGIEDDGSVIGVPNPQELILNINRTIGDTIRPDVMLYTSCEEKRIEGKSVVVVDVRRGTAVPYYLANKGIRPEGVYIRKGASTIPASETMILTMIRDADGEQYEDKRSLNQSLTFDATHFNKNQMKTLGLLNEDDQFTNLALLLSDQCNHETKLALFQGTSKSIFRDRFEFTGSLLRQLEYVLEKIQFYNRTRSEFDFIRRIDSFDYPPEAIREAVMNTFVHREYALSGSTLISLFDDRLEIVSLGGLVRGLEVDDILVGTSLARNKKLSNVFYRLKLIEAYGTGIPKIMESYEGDSRQPELIMTSNVFKIVLPNRNYVREMEVYERQRMNDHVYFETEHDRVLNILRRQPAFTRKEVEKQLNVSQSKAVNVLRAMLEKGLLEKRGAGKNTIYTSEKKEG
jgi:ATP-dependent DNA helicase RecG